MTDMSKLWSDRAAYFRRLSVREAKVAIDQMEAASAARALGHCGIASIHEGLSDKASNESNECTRRARLLDAASKRVRDARQ